MRTICDDGGLSEFVEKLQEKLADLDKNSQEHKALLRKWGHLIELDESNRCILEKHERRTGSKRSGAAAPGKVKYNAYAGRKG